MDNGKTLGQIAYETRAQDDNWSIIHSQTKEEWQRVADAVVAAYEARRWMPIEEAPSEKPVVLFNPTYFRNHGGFDWGYWRKPEDGNNHGFSLFYEVPNPPPEAYLNPADYIEQEADYAQR